MIERFFIGAFPWWAILLLGLGAFALLLQQFLGLKQRLGSKRSWLLTSLRAIVYALLVFFLLGPGLIEKRLTKLRRPLVILLDTSESMSLPAAPTGSNDGKQEKSRIDLVREKLLEGKEPLVQRLARDYDLRLYQFSTRLEPVGPASLPQIGARGRGTRLLEALLEASRQAGTEAGIILFSDGIANGENRSLNESTPFPVPIFAAGAGEIKGFTDVRIARLSVPDFAFRGRELKMDLTIEAHGLAGKSVPLYFNRGTNLVSSRNISIEGDPFEQRLTLSYIPREIGPHSFSLSIPPQAGEQITQNNHREFKVEVQRDKIRVLSLSGSPSWNYRFLRMALKQDPFIDLVSFVFLRTPTDSVDVPDSQISLIPFPIDEIFLQELKNFDLVLFDDFSYQSYFNALYLEKVRDFVRDGGGFAMLGGGRSFDGGGYAETPLQELLPVELNGKGGFQTGTALRGVLTASGKTHPITRLLPDLRANEEAWKKMPALTSLNQVLRAKGEMLLTAAPDGASGGAPLLAVGKYGRGRALALTSGDFWRWNFVAVGEKESPQNHLKLLRQAVRWLAQEPSLEQVQIRSIGGSRAPGEKMDFKVRVLKDDFTPASHAVLRLRVISAEGEQIPVEAAPETEEGEYSAEFTPTKEGAYRLEAEAHLAGRVVGRDRKNFVVAFPFGEIEDGTPRPELLKRIADISRGEFIPLSDWNETSLKRVIAKLDDLAPLHAVERRQIPLWSTLWTFSLILFLLGSEWWLRRTWGLV
ncbi:MAG: VWA domain-containing protein [Deltaproteobacteria bacterium]|nr:VWA domain-containing protein [Deltaproteobacteria bacterium]